MKRLSVIIPGYNNPAWRWKRCVGSVLSAIGIDDEIIIVDDGSQDVVTLATLGVTDNRVKILRQANGGLSRARNFGLANAVGEFVTFVDSDDAVREGTYEVCLAKRDSDIIIYGVNVIWSDVNLQKHDIPTSLDIEILHREKLLNYACNKIYKREFLNRNNLRFNPDGMPCEDIIFNLQCLMAGAKTDIVAYEGYVYYMNANGSIVSSYSKSGLAGTRKAAETWEMFLKKTNSTSAYLWALADYSEATLQNFEWENMWRSNSPYSLRQRLVWIRKHRPRLGWIKIFVLMLAKSFVRRYLYVKALRRRHYRSIYSNVCAMNA